jgi:hypothetical protein
LGSNYGGRREGREILIKMTGNRVELKKLLPMNKKRSSKSTPLIFSFGYNNEFEE